MHNEGKWWPAPTPKAHFAGGCPEVVNQGHLMWLSMMLTDENMIENKQNRNLGSPQTA